MADTLEIFGVEYTDVAGIIATDNNGNELTYTRGGGSSPSLQTKTKTYTPTESQQTETITADSGYDGLSQVSISVGAIDSEYIGSAIDRRSSSDIHFFDDDGYYVAGPPGFYDGNISVEITSGTAGTPTATKGTVSNHSVSVTPSITNTTGYITGGTKTGTAITVSASELVSGTYTVSASGTHDVTNYVSASVASGSATAPASISGTSASITTGTNTITLTKTVSVTPSVTAGYVSSGTAGNSSVSLTASVTVNPTPTASGKTVTIPAGYYSAQTTKDVSTGSATAPSTISGTAASVSTGTNTLTLTKTVSVTPTVSAGYVSAGTAGNSSVSLTASVPTKAAATITPSTTNQTIASGTYLTGTQTILGDANLIGSNIVQGATIFNINGTATFQSYYTGSSAPASSLGNNGDIYLQE